VRTSSIGWLHTGNNGGTGRSPSMHTRCAAVTLLILI